MKELAAFAVRANPAARYVVRGLVIVWAAFWAWFVVSVSLGEPPAPPWWIPAAWLGGLAVLVTLCWRRPLVGGCVLVAAGIWAALYFPAPATRALLAAPALVLGLGCVATGSGARGLAHVVLVLWCVALGGCRAAQDPADLPYRTSSILRHANGRMQRARLVAESEILGLPCRDWIWWYEDGRLDNVELSRDASVQGHDFPAGTRVFFDRDGRLAHAWLSRDAWIDGRPCRGRWKIDTAFHPNGRVRAFFPPATLEIDGVPCAASLFHPVYLRPDGHLWRCRLARDCTLAGRAHHAGEELELDAPVPATR